MTIADKCVYVIETDETDPKPVAVVGSLPVVTADGFRIRPVFLQSLFTDYSAMKELLDR